MLLTAARRSNSNSKHRVRGMDISRGEPVLAAPDRGGGASTASQRVLLVEDENLVALEMEQWLVEAGHEVIGIVSSAEAAIDVAEQRLPDMIVMDIRLAGHRDGVYAAQQI
jgi:PleD family two-component response regulator